MKRIYAPTNGPCDWRRLLADPQKQWRDGHSAKCLAEAWENAAGLPAEVDRLIRKSQLPELQGFELLLGLPEHQVHIPGGGHASQTDLFVLARTSLGLTSMAVEGKVAETFGPTLGEWRADFTRGKQERLQHIQDALGLPAPGDSVRYQLLHRMAAAIYEAKRYGAVSAVMLVHSFSPNRVGFDSYAEFVALFGAQAGEGEFVRLGRPHGTSLLAGWAQG